MPKIETNSRDEMGIQVKLNRGIQQEAKRGVTGVTAGNSAMRPIVVLLKQNVEYLQKHLPACEVHTHRQSAVHFLYNLNRSKMKVYWDECKDKNDEVCSLFF